MASTIASSSPQPELIDQKGRLLNHIEMVHRPGERPLVIKLFRAFGCDVQDIDNFHLPIPIGGADMLNNVVYASEVTKEQWQFEEQLQKALAGESSLSQAWANYDQRFRRNPQYTFHFGIRYPSFEHLEQTLAHLQNELDTELKGRVEIEGIYRPGDPGSMADIVMQVFVRTDILAAGLITLGQHIELQAYRLPQ